MRYFGKFDPFVFLSKKRANKAERRRIVVRRRAKDRARAAAYEAAKRRSFGTRSVILKMLADSSPAPQFAVPQTSLRVAAPKAFSLQTNPEAVIRFVSSLAKTLMSRPLSDIYLEMDAVVEQDLGAHALLDKLVDEVMTECKVRRARLAWRGSFPKNPEQRRFVCAMGIVDQLGISARYLSPADESKIRRFSRHCRHYIRAIRPEVKDEKTKAAEKFAQYVNRCLGSEGKALTPIARHLLCSYVGEVVENAEVHAGMVDWTMHGYLDMSTAQPQCQIIVFNFGKSIAQTLEELPEGSYTREQIAEYLDAHTSGRLFTRAWRREDLLTLVALQGTVSCKNSSEDTTRGNGTADLIEFFQRMHDERTVSTGQAARMFIISGDTRVIFDGTYRISKNSAGTRLIAFNADNDLKRPPDHRYVLPLKSARLPGTMIGVQFPIELPSLQAKETDDERLQH